MKNESHDNANIERCTANENFSILPNQLLQDPDISMDAQGILTYLLSLPHDWKIKPRCIWKAKNIGRDRVYSAIEELINTGYMEKTEKKNGNLKSIVSYKAAYFKKYARHPGSQDTDPQEPESQDSYKGIREERNKNNKPEAPASAPPSSEVVSSFRDDLLGKTELTAPQAMGIKTKFAHLDDKTFKNAIYAFLEYKTKNEVEDEFATITSALSKPWTPKIDRTAKAKEKEMERQKLLDLHSYYGNWLHSKRIQLRFAAENHHDHLQIKLEEWPRFQIFKYDDPTFMQQFKNLLSKLDLQMPK